MAEAGEIVAAAPQGEQILDPFAFLPHVVSRIEGLGGTEQGAEPNYAFHTPYVETAPGQCNFTVRFTGLRAKYGILQLRVHMMATEPGSIARMANMDRIALNRLVQYGGEHSIRFEGFRGYAYALMGLVLGDSDASAESLIVSLDRPMQADEPVVGSDGRTTAYGREATRPVPFLLSLAPPTFETPVTQACTRAQLAEPAFLEWRRELDRDGADELELWREAFVLQALRRYGMLAEGARGLALEVAPGPLTQTLTRHGVELATVARPDAGFGADQVEEVGLAPFPRHLVDYDFAFSTGLLARMDQPAHAMALFEESMACLRPGGLMVHTAPLDLAVETMNAIARHGSFGRGDIERMSLLAISRNHEVAQFKIDQADALAAARSDAAPRERPFGAFGIIARRAASIL